MQTFKFILILTVLSLCGCVGYQYQDLSHYDIRDFENLEAPCNYDRHCKTIGYGIAGSCIAPDYRGYIIYSTKMGSENIEHLKYLVRRSRGLSEPALISVNHELEECILTVAQKPTPVCASRRCKGLNEN